MVPSSIPSINPLTLVMGVRSSWAMLPMKLLRLVSMASRLRAMVLKVAASWATSSAPSPGTRSEKSPPPNRRAASAMRRSGRVSRVVRATLSTLATSSISPADRIKLEIISPRKVLMLWALDAATTYPCRLLSCPVMGLTAV